MGTRQFVILFCLGATLHAADNSPKLRLSEVENIQPTGYTVDLTLDPAKNTFSGTIIIRMDIKEPVQTIWLNQEKIQIQSATLSAGGKTLKAAAIPGGDDFVGLHFPSAVPVGYSHRHHPIHRYRRREEYFRDIPSARERKLVHLLAVRADRRARSVSLLRRTVIQDAVATHAACARRHQCNQQYACTFRKAHWRRDENRRFQRNEAITELPGRIRCRSFRIRECGHRRKE